MVRDLLRGAVPSLITFLCLTACSSSDTGKEEPKRSDVLCGLRADRKANSTLSNLLPPGEARSIAYFTPERMASQLRSDLKDRRGATKEHLMCSFWPEGASGSSTLRVSFHWGSYSLSPDEAKRSRDEYAHFKLGDAAIARSMRGTAFAHMRCLISDTEASKKRTLVATLENDGASAAGNVARNQVVLLRALASEVTERLRCSGDPIDEKSALRSYPTEWDAVHRG